jgi:hypothetical protein
MFQFVYKGKYDCLITKEIFETYVKTLFNNLQKYFAVTWAPKKFNVIMEMNRNKPQGWGGTLKHSDDSSEITLQLMLHGYPKKLQTFEVINKFFGSIVTHEMFHVFIPYIKGNSCWSEGVTDFMTSWYNNNIVETLAQKMDEYKTTKDPIYKAHKYGYLTGFKNMVKIYNEDNSVINTIRKIVKDYHKNDETRNKIYTSLDIISYYPKFKVFFTGKCNKHIDHALS